MGQNSKWGSLKRPFKYPLNRIIKWALSFSKWSKYLSAVLSGSGPSVIAQVQGIATAAGCQMVAWCDLAIAEEGAKFATPGVKIGLFCTTPSVAIVRAIGRKAAMEMLLTGRYVPAREAKELGLINRVVPLDDLDTETEALANQISEASPLTLSIGKQAFYAQVDQADNDAMDFAKQTMTMNLGTEDAQEGIKAFMEKRAPVWRNR